MPMWVENWALIFKALKITWDSFRLDLLMIPLVALGAFLGYYLVRKIPDRKYRWFIIAMTFIAALAMIF